MTRSQLAIKALKTAVSAACGMVVSLNVVDQQHFSIGSAGGWLHLGEAIGISVLIAEARFWKMWADGDSENAAK